MARLIVCILLFGILFCSWTASPALSTLPGVPLGVGMWLDDEANNQIRTAIPFFLLGITLGFALPINVGWRRVTYYWIFMILLAAAAELGQLKLPERQPDIMDFVWGGVGAALGLFPVVAIRMWWQQRSALKRTV